MQEEKEMEPHQIKKRQEKREHIATTFYKVKGN